MNNALPQHPLPWLALDGGRWRTWTALLTVLAFVLLLSSVATHHHDTSQEDRDCALCSAVAHKIAGTPLAPVTTQFVIHLLYRTLVLVAHDVADPVPLHLPPACGPPALS